MQLARHVNKDQIKSSLSALGIGKGDTVFFHSSMKSIGYIEGGPEAVIQAFQETIGTEGTLVLPALCVYDFENMDREAIVQAWDQDQKPTYTGAIPETFRKRPGTIRSNNPTHSVTAAGKHAGYVTQDHYRAAGAEEAEGRPMWASHGAFGTDSPWDRLYELDAKYMLIGVDFHNCTLLHNVQVIYWEQYLAPQDPHACWPILDFRKMGARLDQAGIVEVGMIGNSFTRLVSSKAMVDTALRIMVEGGP